MQEIMSITIKEKLSLQQDAAEPTGLYHYGSVSKIKPFRGYILTRKRSQGMKH